MPNKSLLLSTILFVIGAALAVLAAYTFQIAPLMAQTEWTVATVIMGLGLAVRMCGYLAESP